MQVSAWRPLFAVFLLCCASAAQVPLNSYVNFEGSQTNPVRLSADGTRLFAVNTADARLSVFDASTPQRPRLIAEIPVGIEPVSVNALNDDTAWVVNQVSDSISIVSVSRGIVTSTIYLKDEPSDVVFAGGRAFVSVSRSNEVRVFDTATHALVAAIPFAGENPRALAVNSSGTKVYTAFALSGNRSTIIPANLAPPQPAPTNPALPAPPRAGLIVDASDPAWASVIKYKMPDNDVAEIDATSLAVTRYFSGIGTINLGLAVHPTNGDIFVANWEDRNLVRFEPNLRSHTADHRVTRVSAANGQVTSIDLNPGLDYGRLPNDAAKSTALSLPANAVFTPDGSALYVAAFGTDRIGRLDVASNKIGVRIDLGAAGAAADPRHKRGPRGLALNAAAKVLYVLNRISNTISLISLDSNSVVAEIPVGSFDPTPIAIREGRGFLYDARLSGNGTVACASCHIDSDMDLLAWDLGDPGGSVQTVNQLPLGTFHLHPMKGPMTTLALRGLNGLQPFHWRGDRAELTDFNSSFDSLLGGSPLSDADMAAFRDFVNTVVFQPNPNQNLDRTLPAAFNGGDPNAGRTAYTKNQFILGVTCNTCHTAPGPGTDLLIFPASLLQIPQDMKVPQLRNMYQKVNFNNADGATSIDGFGFEHDGNITSLFSFLSQPIFQKLASDTKMKNDIAAFVMCFDTGTAPAVGYSRTLNADTLTVAANDWILLENQAALANIDLIAKGSIDGKVHGLLYRPTTKDYITDRTGLGPFTSTELKARIAGGDTLTFMGVPPGSGRRMGIDRNLDGVLDGDAAPREIRPKH